MPSHYQQGSNDIKYIVSNRINEYIHVIWLYVIYQEIIMFHIALKYYCAILGMGLYQGFDMCFISLYGALSLYICSSSGLLVFTCLGGISLDHVLNNNSTDSYISYRGIYSS